MLDALRKDIDLVDTQIIELLAKRASLVQKISIIKKENNLPVFQPARKKELFVQREETAVRHKLEPEYIHHIWDIIHERSVKAQQL